MIILKKEVGKQIPEELLTLSESINALPGLSVTSAFFTFDKIKASILIHVDEKCQDGLFFLVRSIDVRYFYNSKYFNIELSIGDMNWSNGDLPIFYELRIEDCYKIDSLIDSLNTHYHHEAFMSLYKLDKEQFSVVDTIVENRNSKLNQIL